MIKMQELLGDEETAVATHQSFQDAYNQCCVWLRTVTDELASYSGGQDEKEKLEANVGRIKVIFRFCAMFVSEVIPRQSLVYVIVWYGIVW